MCDLHHNVQRLVSDDVVVAGVYAASTRRHHRRCAVDVSAASSLLCVHRQGSCWSRLSARWYVCSCPCAVESLTIPVAAAARLHLRSQRQHCPAAEQNRRRRGRDALRGCVSATEQDRRIRCDGGGTALRRVPDAGSCSRLGARVLQSLALEAKQENPFVGVSISGVPERCVCSVLTPVAMIRECVRDS